MYCPNCGQQQATEQMRFCSRCGFPLGLVSEILANGGFLPQLASLGNKKHWLTRRNVFIFGLVWFAVFTFLIVPIIAVLFGDSDVGEQIIPFVAIIGVMGGLLTMLFSLFFQSAAKFNAENIQQKQQFIPQNQFGTTEPQNALPPPAANFNPVNSATAYQPPQKQPVRGGWRDAKTGELIPPSVTEDTTRMLNKNE